MITITATELVRNFKKFLAGKEPVYISPVTIAELKYGAEIAADPNVRQKRLAALRGPQCAGAGRAGVDGVAKSMRVIGKGNRERLMPLPEAFGQVFGYWLSDKANARKSPYGYSFATTPAIRSSLTCV
jgi:site-specific recombinase XerC